MRDFKLLNSDLDLSNYGLQLVSDLDYIQQKLAITLRLFRNEWFLNIDAGIDYYTDILKKDIDGARIEAVLKSAILAVPGVLALTSFDMNLSTSRQLTVDFSVSTDLGELTINEVLP